MDFKELTEQEKFLKKLYQGQYREILSVPMQYATYQKLMKEHPQLQIEEDLYTKYSKDHHGITVVDVEKTTENAEINMVRHSRYSYPILHNHSFVEIAYVYSGKCTHYVENQAFEMKEGDLCILAPESMHTITALDDESIVLNILMSKKQLDESFLAMVKEKHLLADFFENILYGKSVSPYIIFPTGQDEWIKLVYEHMFQEITEKRYAYRQSLELYVRQLFIHIIRNYEMLAQVSKPLDRKPDENVVAVLGYISVNYNKVTLKNVAEFFNYSESYMSRMLKKYTGKTFVVLVNSLQMKCAAEMLSTTDKSLSEISQEVGCFDYSHFSKKFKKEYDMTPDMYRRNHRLI